MKVVFQSTGEIKDVAEGYARNFLFKSGKAVPATPDNIKKAEELRAKFSAEVEASEAQWAELIEKLPKTTVTLTQSANAEGKLFGSVTSDVIIDALKAQHSIALNAEWLALQPIKTTGSHTVAVKFPHKKQSQLIVLVNAQ
ncbi:MAG: 50S ribosomal protein L9 [Candidatus Kerfeldbacteria bacterium]|nr:50S ribosomal protein L9 [Candidatus Kerfeldbacteria bacterium]